MSKAQLKDVSKEVSTTQEVSATKETSVMGTLSDIANTIINNVTQTTKKDVKVDFSKSYKGISNIELVKDAGKTAAFVAGHEADKQHLIEVCKVLNSRGVVIGQLNKKADSVGYAEAMAFKAAFTLAKPDIKAVVLNNYMSEVRKAVASGKDFSFNSARGESPKSGKSRTTTPKTLDDYILKAFELDAVEGKVSKFELLCRDLEAMYNDGQVDTLYTAFVWYLQNAGHELKEYDTVILNFDTAAKVDE